MVYQEYNYYWR